MAEEESLSSFMGLLLSLVRCCFAISLSLSLFCSVRPHVLHIFLLIAFTLITFAQNFERFKLFVSAMYAVYVSFIYTLPAQLVNLAKSYKQVEAYMHTYAHTSTCMRMHVVFSVAL